MRILLIVVYYPPSTTSAAQMMQDLALEYLRQGHQVTVATPSDAVKGKVDISNEDGVTVLRIRCGDLKNTNKIVRMWRESRLSNTVWSGARDFLQANACDLIVFYSPTIFFGRLVRRLKSLWACPAYLILRDIFPKWAVDTGLLREGALYRYLKRKEAEQYAAADVIGVEARGDLPYFHKELGSGASKVEVLFNWLDTRRTPERTSTWRRRLGLEGKVVFFYGGNIGVAQDMDNIVRLAKGLREYEDVFFLLMGSGSEVKRLNAEIEEAGLRNIKIHPPVPQNEYMRCLSELDVGLVSLDRRLTSHNYSGKLLGYVACGKPILASVSPGHDLIDLLHRTDAGLACANGEDKSLLAAALLLASDAERRARMGRNARKLADSLFSVGTIAKQILSHFDVHAGKDQIISR
jgi:O26-antigen biosynthesis N-acetyl-L-fucosamine transferase